MASGSKTLEVSCEGFPESSRVVGDRAEDRFQSCVTNLLGHTVDVTEPLRGDRRVVYRVCSNVIVKAHSPTFTRVLCGIGNRVWYSSFMNGTYSIRMGDRGRLVVPSEVRMRAGLAAGTPMVLVESENGLVLLTREQLLTRVRRNLDGRDLIGDLLEQRRHDAAREDAV